MSISRSIRYARRETKDNEELELDESLLQEGRLKNLLTTNKRTLNRPRDVFNNIQEDVPKLRKSIVDRALQTYVSSTPMPKESKRDFFCTEHSLNISPIRSNSENLDNDPQEYNKEKANKKNNEEKKLLINEPYVSLNKSPIPILISDSSDDIVNTDGSKNKPGSKHVVTENNKQIKSPYNTRSVDRNKITKGITQDRESAPNEISQILDVTQATTNLKKQVSIASNVKGNKKAPRSTSSNRKRIDIVLPRKPLSPNRSNQSRNGVNEHNELLSKQIESSTCSRSRKKAQNILPKNHDLEPNISKKKTLKSSTSKISVKEVSDIENAQISADEINKTKTLNRNNTFNDGIDNVNVAYSQQSLRATRKKSEKTSNEINCHNTVNESSRRIVTEKNVITKRVDNQKGMSPRKLSFLHKDYEARNDIDVLGIESSQTKKADGDIKQPAENLSKIHVLRNGSKSKQICVDRTTKSLRNNSISIEPVTKNNCNSCKGNVEQIEKIIYPPESPPKRPQRIKKNQRKKNLLEQESIEENKLASITSQQIPIEPPETKNKSTIVIENGKKNDISLKQMGNDFKKDIVQNDCSPNKLETVHAKISQDTSSDNLKEKPREVTVLSNILISEKTEDRAAKDGKTLENTDHMLEKEHIPTKTYTEIGTSPLILENEIRSINSENNLVAAKSSEGTFKGNNNIVAENKEDPNLEKSLVEIGTSPIKFMGKETDIYRKTVVPKKALAEAGTSPWNLESTMHRETSEVRCRKTEKLNQLLFKLSNGLLTPPCTSNSQINSNNGRLVHTNQSLHKEIQTSTKALSDYSSSSKRINKEIQTSIKSVHKRTPYRKNFSRNIFTQTVLEQGTQTSSSLSRISKSCRKHKIMEKEGVNNNNSDSSNTDQSEMLKEYDSGADPMLFQSLANEIIPPNFSSSDDDVLDDTLRNDDSQNRPWRLDDDLLPLPRKSSLKLNFIRSAHDIELERNFTINSNKSMISSNSNSELEGKNLEKTEYGHYKQTNGLSYARRSKLQIYSRPTIQNNERQPRELKSDLLKSTDDEKRLPSSQSCISDIFPIESTYKTNQRYQEKREIPHKDNKLPSSLVNEAPSHLPDNIKGNICLDNQTIEENLTQQGVNISVEATKDIPHSPGKAISTINMHSLIVVVENNAQLMIDKLNLNKSNDSCTPTSKNESIKGIDKSTNNHETRSKSTKHCNNDKKQKVNKSDNEDEILATPLEDSDIPQLQLNDISDKPENTENLADSFKEISSSVNNAKTCDSGTSLSAKQVKQHIFKVPKSRKTQVQKSKKKLLPETDAGVSSTIDSTQPTGIRRSGRERKPVQRRFSGIVATSNKREIDYYNGTLGTSVNVTVNKSSRPSTIKKRKESKNEVVKKKGGKRSVKNQIREEKEDNLVAVEEVEMNNTDEADIITQVPNNGDTPETHNKVKKHHMTDDISSTTDNISNKEMYLTPKRNKLAHGDHSPTINSRKKNSFTNKTNKKDTVSSTSHLVSSKTCQNTNVCVDNNHICDNLTTNDNNNGTNNYTNGSTSQDNINNFSTEPAIKHNDRNRFSTFNTNMLQDNNQTTEDNTQNKDSGTSTMLRSTTTEDSNFQTSKLLTGRISKKYKKKDYICNKISKVLSRSINHSGEMELLNENDMTDSVSMGQTSVTKPKNEEYINMLRNNDIISMKYVEKVPNFKLMNDLMVTDLLTNHKDGGAMGYLKLPPGTRKPLRIATKFMLFYSVIEGEAFIQVHNKSTRVGKLSDFIIPLGAEYSINNVSKEDSLTLHFVKVPSTVGS